MSVGCSVIIAVDPPETCGIPAAGRCPQCGQPCCASHLGWGSATRCASCIARERDNQETRERVQREEEAQAKVELANLTADLRRRVGERGQRARQVRSGQKKKLFGGYEDIYTDLESAWPVGTILWHTVDGSKDGESRKLDELQTGVTSAGEIVAMQPYSTYGMMGGYRQDLSVVATKNVVTGLIQRARLLGVDLLSPGREER